MTNDEQSESAARTLKLAALGLVAIPLGTLAIAHAGNWFWAQGFLSTNSAEIASTAMNIAAVLAITACAVALINNYRERRASA